MTLDEVNSKYRSYIAERDAWHDTKLLLTQGKATREEVGKAQHMMNFALNEYKKAKAQYDEANNSMEVTL